MNIRAAYGFTLVESLVALLVVAVAYAGVLTALSGFADQRWLVDQRNIAHRLAWDQLINRYLVTTALLQQEGGDNKDVGILSLNAVTWQWQIERKRTEEGTLSRYQADVSIVGDDQDRPVRSLVIFLP